MFHGTIFEGYRPVGRIIAHRGRNVEAFWQFGIYGNIGARIEVFHELAFHTLLCRTIGKHIIHDALPALVSLVERGMLLLRKDGGIVASLYLVVTDMIYDDGGFLLQYQAAYPADKLFRIHLVHIKLFWLNLTQNPGDGLAGQSGVGGYLAQQVVLYGAYDIRSQVIMLHFFLHHHAARLHVVVLQFRLLHSSGYHVAQFRNH